MRHFLLLDLLFGDLLEGIDCFSFLIPHFKDFPERALAKRLDDFEIVRAGFPFRLRLHRWSQKQ